MTKGEKAMTKKSKAIIVCVLVLMCGIVQANTNHIEQYNLDYAYCPKKSFRKIIREVINKKQQEKEMPFPKIKTVPVPLYDAIDNNLYNNLA